jgi:alpha-glucosidase
LPVATLTESPSLERLPVFIRPGSILPRQPLVQSTGQKPNGPLELAVYPGPDCHGQLYFDDGTSLAYKHGAYLRQTVRCDIGARRLSLVLNAREGSYSPWWNRIALTIYGMISAPHGVRLDNVPVPNHYDSDSHALHVDIPDRSRAAHLTVDTSP